MGLRIKNSDKRELSVFSNYFCVTSGTWSISLRSTWRRTTCVTGCEWYPQHRTRMSCGTSKSIMRTKMRREKMNLNLVHICNSELKSQIKEALRSSICRWVDSRTGKTTNTRNISGMLLCCKKKANRAWETKPQARMFEAMN